MASGHTVEAQDQTPPTYLRSTIRTGTAKDKVGAMAEVDTRRNHGIPSQWLEKSSKIARHSCERTICPPKLWRQDEQPLMTILTVCLFLGKSFGGPMQKPCHLSTLDQGFTHKNRTSSLPITCPTSLRRCPGLATRTNFPLMCDRKIERVYAM